MTATLGYHVNTWTAEAKATIERTPPAIFKVLSTAVDVETLEDWRTARPDGILIYRQYLGDENLTPVERRVRHLLEGAAPIRHLRPILESPWNEAWQNGAELDAYAAATIVATEMIHEAGYPVAVGNFSVGNPARLEDWARFYPALVKADYLSLHEYGRPTMQTDATWWALRYRRVYDFLPPELRRPLIISECGLDWTGLDWVDSFGKHPYGWRSREVDPAAYAAQLRWYAGEISKDPYVVGATIFACGTFEDFRSFDVAGVAEIESVVAEYNMVGKSIGGKTMDQTKLRFANWQIAAAVNGNDPLDIRAFARHIEDTGGNPDDLAQYGCPVAVKDTGVDVVSIKGHADAIGALVRPFV